MLISALPLHITYFTVWSGKGGELKYHGDPYGHVTRVSLALAQKWDAIDKGVDHLTAVSTKELQGVDVQEPSTASRTKPAAEQHEDREARSPSPPSRRIVSRPAPALARAHRERT